MATSVFTEMSVYEAGG